MKTGKVPEAVLKRSVLAQITHKRPEVLVGAGIGEDAAVAKIPAGETLDVREILPESGPAGAANTAPADSAAAEPESPAAPADGDSPDAQANTIENT